ncbi:MAG: hypothetical protein A4E53_02422 [Pelotomaculum sp. PtaB.Bin104]|nr:MAG: hypothetical protein A4E53_02422 [Pelotomaculum sp. PtaB.Bin104]
MYPWPFFTDSLIPEASSPEAGVPPHEVLGVPPLVGMHHFLRRSDTGQNGHNAGNGVGVPVLDIVLRSIHVFNEFGAPGQVEVFGAAHGDRFDVLVAHYGAAAESAGAGPALLDGSQEATVLAGQTDSGHAGVGLIQLLFDDFPSFYCAFTF